MADPREKLLRGEQILWPILTGIGLVLLWYAVAAIVDQSPFTLPYPHLVVGALVENASVLSRSSLHTLTSAVLGFLGASLIGLGGGAFLASGERIRRALLPWFVLVQLTPLVVITLILEVLLGPSRLVVILVAILISFFPVLLSTLRGLGEIDRSRQELFRLYGASRWQELRLLRWPSARPAIASGLMIAASLAVVGTVTSELLVGTVGRGGGLGYRAQLASSMGDTPLLYAVAVMTLGLGLTCLGLVWLIAGRWSAQARRPSS